MFSMETLLNTYFIKFYGGLEMKKYLLTALLLFTLLMTLIACGSEEASSDTDVKNPATAQTKVELPDEPDESDVSVNIDTDAEVDTVTEEPVVDMVSWEEWATQPDSEKPCLVVWNETTGKQIIVEENGKYITEEGDKLAVPIKGDLAAVCVNETSQNFVKTEYGDYYEIVLENETWNSVNYTFNGENYEYAVKNH